MAPRMAHRPPHAARRLMLALALSAGVLSATPHAARAASSSSDDDVENYDGRVMGYTPDAESKSSSVGGLWVLLILLGGGCVGVMFMNPKRSHLD